MASPSPPPKQVALPHELCYVCGSTVDGALSLLQCRQCKRTVCRAHRNKEGIFNHYYTCFPCCLPVDFLPQAPTPNTEKRRHEPTPEPSKRHFGVKYSQKQQKHRGAQNIRSPHSSSPDQNSPRPPHNAENVTASPNASSTSPTHQMVATSQHHERDQSRADTVNSLWTVNEGGQKCPTPELPTPYLPTPEARRPLDNALSEPPWKPTPIRPQRLADQNSPEPAANPPKIITAPRRDTAKEPNTNEAAPAAAAKQQGRSGESPLGQKAGRERNNVKSAIPYESTIKNSSLTTDNERAIPSSNHSHPVDSVATPANMRASKQILKLMSDAVAPAESVEQSTLAHQSAYSYQEVHIENDAYTQCASEPPGKDTGTSVAQKAILTASGEVPHLPQGERVPEGVLAAFNAFDRDRDGVLSRAEAWLYVMRENELLNAADVRRLGLVPSVDNFEGMTVAQYYAQTLEEFEAVQKERLGCVSQKFNDVPTAVVTLIAAYCNKFSASAAAEAGRIPKGVDACFAAFDRDRDGKLSRAEAWLYVMRQHDLTNPAVIRSLGLLHEVDAAEGMSVDQYYEKKVQEFHASRKQIGASHMQTFPDVPLEIIIEIQSYCEFYGDVAAAEASLIPCGVQEAFNCFDRDRDGKLSRAEAWLFVMRQFDLTNASQVRSLGLLSAVDDAEGMTVDEYYAAKLDEFFVAMKKIRATAQFEDIPEDAVTDIQAFCEVHASAAFAEQSKIPRLIKLAFSAFDRDGDGKLSRAEAWLYVMKQYELSDPAQVRTESLLHCVDEAEGMTVERYFRLKVEEFKSYQEGLHAQTGSKVSCFEDIPLEFVAQIHSYCDYYASGAAAEAHAVSHGFQLAFDAFDWDRDGKLSKAEAWLYVMRRFELTDPDDVRRLSLLKHVKEAEGMTVEQYYAAKESEYYKSTGIGSPKSGKNISAHTKRRKLDFGENTIGRIQEYCTRYASGAAAAARLLEPPPRIRAVFRAFAGGDDESFSRTAAWLYVMKLYDLKQADEVGILGILNLVDQYTGYTLDQYVSDLLEAADDLETVVSEEKGKRGQSMSPRHGPLVDIPQEALSYVALYCEKHAEAAAIQAAIPPGVRAVFRAFDQDGDGRLSRAEAWLLVMAENDLADARDVRTTELLHLVDEYTGFSLAKFAEHTAEQFCEEQKKISVEFGVPQYPEFEDVPKILVEHFQDYCALHGKAAAVLANKYREMPTQTGEPEIRYREMTTQTIGFALESLTAAARHYPLSPKEPKNGPVKASVVDPLVGLASPRRPSPPKHRSQRGNLTPNITLPFVSLARPPAFNAPLHPEGISVKTQASPSKKDKELLQKLLRKVEQVQRRLSFGEDDVAPCCSVATDTNDETVLHPNAALLFRIFARADGQQWTFEDALRFVGFDFDIPVDEVEKQEELMAIVRYWEGCTCERFCYLGGDMKCKFQDHDVSPDSDQQDISAVVVTNGIRYVGTSPDRSSPPSRLRVVDKSPSVPMSELKSDDENIWEEMDKAFEENFKATLETPAKPVMNPHQESSSANTIGGDAKEPFGPVALSLCGFSLFVVFLLQDQISAFVRQRIEGYLENSLDSATTPLNSFLWQTSVFLQYVPMSGFCLSLGLVGAFLVLPYLIFYWLTK